MEAKYNLLHAVEEKHDTVLTFGCAYSNHICATAAACQELGLKSVGIIRGEETWLLIQLYLLRKCGMTLQYIAREVYRRKSESKFLKIFSDYQQVNS